MQDSPLNKLSNQNKSELYSYVKKNINKHIHSSECTDLVLDAKDPEGKTLKFYLKFKDGSTIVSSNTHKVVVDLTSKFLKKYLTKQEFKKINFKIIKYPSNLQTNSNFSNTCSPFKGPNLNLVQRD